MDLARVVIRVVKGCLVEVRFLSDRGREESTTGDHPCIDAQFKKERFAYFPVFGSCAHAVDVSRVEEEGDEIYLHGKIGEMNVRVHISPVWLDEQREMLEEWRAEKDAGFVEREFKRVMS